MGGMRGRAAIAAAACALVVAGLGGALTWGAGSHPARARLTYRSVPVTATRPATSLTAPSPTEPATTAPSTTTTSPPATTAPTPVPTTRPAPPPANAFLAGCPPPPHAPIPPSPPWHPKVLVPDRNLPPVQPPAPWRSAAASFSGTGMWIWQWQRTDGGDAKAIVRQATAAHLRQLWVRVGDSMNGFYGAPELGQLVPVAHAAGLSVIAWGFPYLYDPVGDAAWTRQVLAWHDAGGRTVDGFSPDIEMTTEGVDLTAQRVAVYLQEVRRAAGSRPVVATVYPPSDANWTGGQYPYRAIAPYVDGFAPMIYWECTDPGADATLDVSRLATLRPVHIIGQAFDMADVGGRTVAPSGAEITEFLQAGRRAGAVGASLWVWQDATPGEWAAMSAYRW